MKLTFNQYVFLKIKPRMLCKPIANGLFNLVPLENPFSSLQYVLVNQDKKMFKMNFASEEELIATIFDAKEIWYGLIKYRLIKCPIKYSNALYGKKDVMNIRYDFEVK